MVRSDSLFDVIVVVGLELGCLLVVFGLRDLEIGPLHQVIDKVINSLAGDQLRVNEEEFHVDRAERVLVQEEVSVGLEQLRNLLRLHLVNETTFKLQVHRGWELSILGGLLDDGNVLLGVQMVEATRARCIHHHPIELVLRIVTAQHDRAMLKIFGILVLFG